MSIILFIIFLSSIKLLFSHSKKYIFNFNENILDSMNHNIIIKEEQPEPFKCLEYINATHINKSDFVEFSKCFLNYTKYDIDGSKDFLKLIVMFLSLRDDLDKNDKLYIIYKVLKESQDNGLIDKLFNLLRNNFIIADSIISLLDEYKRTENMEKMNYTKVWVIFSKLFEVNGLYEILLDIYTNSGKDLFDLLSSILSNFPALSNVYELIRYKIRDGESQILLLELGYNLLKNYYNASKVIEIGLNFLKKNKKLFPILEEIMKNKNMGFIYERVLIFDDYLKNTLKNVIIQNEESIHLLFEICNNDNILEEASSLLIHIENDTYLKENIPNFVSQIINLNSSYIDKLSNIFLYLAEVITKDEELFTGSNNVLLEKLRNFFIKSGFNSSLDVSHDCKDLFNFTFFNYNSTTKQLFFLFVQKFFLDSSMNKGDLLTYDNCLMLGDEFKNKSNYYSYIIYPSYIIAFINVP